MGRRSRKRAPTTRAERDAARREPSVARRSASQRPPAPWGSFPLSELVILAGIVVIFWGLFSGGDEGNERVAGGLVLASLGGGELALREHLGGYRSHSSLLAGVAAFVAVTAVALGLGPVAIWALLIVGVAVFGGTFYAMRELFKRRSGGVSFR
ncbi:MAG: hypothetical protein ACRDN8_13355 [Thermoleophilaceae bacterium]